MPRKPSKSARRNSPFCKFKGRGSEIPRFKVSWQAAPKLGGGSSPPKFGGLQRREKRTVPPQNENLWGNFSDLKEKLSRQVVDTKTLWKPGNHIYHRSLSSVAPVLLAEKSSSLEQGGVYFFFPGFGLTRNTECNYSENKFFRFASVYVTMVPTVRTKTMTTWTPDRLQSVILSVVLAKLILLEFRDVIVIRGVVRRKCYNSGESILLRIKINSVQTRCIVKARLRKVHFSGDFLGVFDFLRIACSLGIPQENL